MRVETVRLRLARAIDADPASTALLLAGPSVLDLWPGSPAAAAAVVAGPPHRTPTAFVHRFSWTGPDLPPATGVLRLTPAPGAHGTPSTSAEVSVVVPEPPTAVPPTVLEVFLQALARTAKERRQAA